MEAISEFFFCLAHFDRYGRDFYSNSFLRVFLVVEAMVESHFIFKVTLELGKKKSHMFKKGERADHPTFYRETGHAGNICLKKVNEFRTV